MSFVRLIAFQTSFQFCRWNHNRGVKFEVIKICVYNKSAVGVNCLVKNGCRYSVLGAISAILNFFWV